MSEKGMKKSPWLRLFVIVLTFLCVFSDGKMRIMNHWQTFSYGWVVLATVYMLRYSVAPEDKTSYRRILLVAIAAIQTALILSALYCAVRCITPFIIPSIHPETKVNSTPGVRNQSPSLPRRKPCEDGSSGPGSLLVHCVS